MNRYENGINFLSKKAKTQNVKLFLQKPENQYLDKVKHAAVTEVIMMQELHDKRLVFKEVAKYWMHLKP